LLCRLLIEVFRCHEPFWLFSARKVCSDQYSLAKYLIEDPTALSFDGLHLIPAPGQIFAEVFSLPLRKDDPTRVDFLCSPGS
jgi:hypothetical protein